MAKLAAAIKRYGDERQLFIYPVIMVAGDGIALKSTAARTSAGVGDGDGEASPLPVSAGVGGRVVRESRETFGHAVAPLPNLELVGAAGDLGRDDSHDGGRTPRWTISYSAIEGRSCTLSLAPTSDFNALKTPLEKSKLVADGDNFKLELKLEPRRREFTLKIVVLSKDTKRRVGGARVEVKATGRKTALCDLKTTTHTASATGEVAIRWAGHIESIEVADRNAAGGFQRVNSWPAWESVQVGRQPPPHSLKDVEVFVDGAAPAARGGAGGGAAHGGARADGGHQEPASLAHHAGRRWRQAVAEGARHDAAQARRRRRRRAAPRPPARNDQVGD